MRATLLLMPLLLFSTPVAGADARRIAADGDEWYLAAANLRATYPQVVAIELGAGWGRFEHGGLRFGGRGWVGALSLGVLGAKAKIGYGAFTGSIGAMVGYRVQAGWLRTWGWRHETLRNANAWGVEADGTFRLVSGSLGAFISHRGDPILSAGLGVGF